MFRYFAVNFRLRSSGMYVGLYHEKKNFYANLKLKDRAEGFPSDWAKQNSLLSVKSSARSGGMCVPRHQVQDLFDQWKELSQRKEYAAALHLALNLPFDEDKLSPRCAAHVAIMRGHCYREIRDLERAHAQYRQAMCSNELNAHELRNTLVHLAVVERVLHDLDMSLATLRLASSYCCIDFSPGDGIECKQCANDRAHIVKYISIHEKWMTTPGYSTRRDAEEKRICHYCYRVALGTAFILCGCKHVRYCDEVCKAADAEAHANAGFHMVLERLPAHIFQQHILPLCILPEDTNLKSRIGRPKHQELVKMRRQALGLRTVNRWWKRQVDQCRRFWLDVIPFDWHEVYKPNPDTQGKYEMDELRTYILQWAIYNGEHELKTQRNDLIKEITKLRKATDKLRESIKEKEAKEAAFEKNLEGVESRLKKMKK